jgi:hypothetical protein
MGFIVRALFSILCEFPGAFVVWLFTGRKKPYKDILDHGNFNFNSFIGLLVVAGILNLIVFIFKHIVDIFHKNDNTTLNKCFQSSTVSEKKSSSYLRKGDINSFFRFSAKNILVGEEQQQGRKIAVGNEKS